LKVGGAEAAEEHGVVVAAAVGTLVVDSG